MSLIEPIGNIHDQYGNIIRRKETGTLGNNLISSQFKGKHVNFESEKKHKKIKRKIKDNKDEISAVIYGMNLDNSDEPKTAADFKDELWYKELKKNITKSQAWIRKNPRDINRRRQLKEEKKELVKLTQELKKSGGLKKKVSKSEFEKARIDLKSRMNL